MTYRESNAGYCQRCHDNDAWLNEEGTQCDKCDRDDLAKEVAYKNTAANIAFFALGALTAWVVIVEVAR